MRIPLMPILAALIMGSILSGVESSAASPNSPPGVSAKSANEPLYVLRRFDTLKNSHWASPERRYADEARWFKGRLAVFHATADAVRLDRLDEWPNHRTDSVPTVTDQVAALRAAQVLVSMHTDIRDAFTNVVPTSWEACRDEVLKRVEQSTQVLGRLPVPGMLATLKHSGGAKNRERVQFFSLLRDLFMAIGIDHNLDIQRWHMSPLNFNFEGHGPFGYEGFGSFFVVGILYDGYRDPQADSWRDSHWFRTLIALAVQSPCGEMPIGGRCAHYIWVEAENASILEMYAAACAKAAYPLEDGMSNCGALLALRSIDRWITPVGYGQEVTNWYPPEKRHCYMSFSHFANCNLFAMSMLASLWNASDDEVIERPADLGGIQVRAPELASVAAIAGGA